MNIKAAFFDIDNTLYNWKKREFVPSGIEAIKALKRKGIKVFLASARPYRSQVEFGAFALGIHWDGYISSSGAIAVIGNHYVKKTLMAEQDVHALVALARKNDLTMEVVTPKTRFLIAPGNTYLESYHGTYSDTTPPVHAYRGGQCTGVLLFAPSLHDEEFMTKLPHLEYYRFHECGLDIMPSEHRKGDGIAAILNALGFKKEEAISFGDDTQDITMGEASFLVCMGNGKDEVKEAADYVALPIAEDGLAKALYDLGVLP